MYYEVIEIVVGIFMRKEVMCEGRKFHLAMSIRVAIKVN